VIYLGNNCKMWGGIMTHKIVHLEAMKMVGYSIKTTMLEVVTDNPVPAFWEQILKDGRFDKLLALNGGSPRSYGVCAMQNQENIDYIAAVALPDGVDAPIGYSVVDIPAGEYLAFETDIANIHAAYGYANEWTPKNGYTWAHGISLEMYDEGHRETQLFHLYIPIKKL